MTNRKDEELRRWTQLADPIIRQEGGDVPPDELQIRVKALRTIAGKLISLRGEAFAQQVRHVVVEHQHRDPFRPLVHGVQDRVTRAAKSAATAERSIRQALERVLNVHRGAWTTGYWTPAWDIAFDWYQRTLKIVEKDPAFSVLRNASIRPPQRGNPLKSRNKALREALSALKLKPQQIRLILRGIGFTTGR